uniref:Uncharacterized protein n=1 Tax=Emiliania huxleyi TaxID=2903 RepID=A0A6V2T1Y2_EMIHU
MEAMTALGLGRKVQTQLSEEMFRRAVYFAVEQDVRGQKPRPDKRTRTGDAAADTGGGEADSSGGGSGPCGFTYGDANDAEYVALVEEMKASIKDRGQFDVAALPRLILNDDATPNHVLKAWLDAARDEIWRLRVELADARGERVRSAPQKRKTPWQPPSRHSSRAERRKAQRDFSQCLAFFRAAAARVDADGHGHVGFENLLAELLRRGLPGSGALMSQRLTTKRVIHLIQSKPAIKREWDKEARKTKVYSTGAQVADALVVGQKRWDLCSKYSNGQQAGKDQLRRAGAEQLAHFKMYVRCGPTPEVPTTVGDDEDVAAAQQRAAREAMERAEATVAREARASIEVQNAFPVVKTRADLLSSMYCAETLAGYLCFMLLGRSLWNMPTGLSSNATNFGFTLSLDAGRRLTASARAAATPRLCALRQGARAFAPAWRLDGAVPLPAAAARGDRREPQCG